ncbi:hypothetical protein GCG21_08990 [Pseudactinotalea sp. HY160]|uniref:hypothetical protein n=1 Tax=Pseudactinotalea sp. HY160 TaxID=2654490 RepID=UPI00128C369F|nr:hypothetical protein [Pseudactinotalea sp. HY160]MPV50138.1 hypothetical protein [Pseudactinotalea sp. HY160]
MAYCRWSSDDYQCDLYVYDSDIGGQEILYIHVASKRVQYQSPLPEPVNPDQDLEGWLTRHRRVGQMLDEATSVPIGGPYDGQTFEFGPAGNGHSGIGQGELAAAISLVEELIAAGYRAPGHLLDALREEAEQASCRSSDERAGGAAAG